MAFSLDVQLYRAGSPLAEFPCESARVEHRAMGGAMSAEFSLAKTWDDSLIAAPTDQIFFYAGGVLHFTGFVGPIRKTFRDGMQTIPGTGLWNYLKTVYPLGATPSVDHETFGAGSADNPTLATAFDVADYLFDTYVSPLNLVTAPSSTFVEPSASTKLGADGFAIRQNDSVASVLEALAIMDDGWAGITADGRLYYMDRATMLGETTRGSFTGSAQASLTRGEVNELGFTLLDAEIESEAYPETRVAIYGRDKSQFTRAVRVYSLAGSSQPSRTHSVYVPGAIRGQAARRYARGRLARFGLVASERVVRASVNVASSTPLEPWRGRVAVYDETPTLIDQGVIGSCSISYEGAITATLSIGEQLLFDPASRDPAINPAAPTFQRIDDPVVEIGDSGDIDFDDGFDGDGNDLHTNGAYVNQEDPGDGFYGTDLADAANVPGGGTGSGSAGPSRLIYSPDPPLRTQTLLLSYAPNAGPLADAEDVNLQWWKNAKAVDLGEVAMTWNESISRWEASVSVPADAVQLNIQFNNTLSDPLDIVDDNGGNDWNLTTQAYLTNDANFAIPLHGHSPDLPQDGGDIFQNFAYPGVP